jgi:hypothetical protein
MLITPPGTTSGSNPLIKLWEAALLRIFVNTSATRLKRIGELGSPCLSPLPALKKGPLKSLSLTQN